MVKNENENGLQLSEKYCLTVREAADYFSICVKSMRRLAEAHQNEFAVYMGNRYLIIRHRFEEFLLGLMVAGSTEELTAFDAEARTKE